jgi:hypothetical protein
MVLGGLVLLRAADLAFDLLDLLDNPHAGSLLIVEISN